MKRVDPISTYKPCTGGYVSPFGAPTMRRRTHKKSRKPCPKRAVANRYK